MTKEIMLQLLIKRATTDQQKLLYLFLRDKVVTEEKAWSYGIDNIGPRIHYLRQKGWIIQNTESFTYELIDEEDQEENT